jgi:hypothetical protein
MGIGFEIMGPAKAYALSPTTASSSSKVDLSATSVNINGVAFPNGTIRNDTKALTGDLWHAATDMAYVEFKQAGRKCASVLGGLDLYPASVASVVGLPYRAEQRAAQPTAPTRTRPRCTGGSLVTLTPIVFSTSLSSSPPIRIEMRSGRGDRHWAIVRGVETLNLDLEWEYEPSPSQRDDVYLARNRFTFDDAKETLERWVLQELQPVRVVEEVSR